jgi:hypothetical protein
VQQIDDVLVVDLVVTDTHLRHELLLVYALEDLPYCQGDHPEVALLPVALHGVGLA